ncbi:hypothetical protein F4604DRAFT_1807597 [Suillus subluteus]|nr:hypothetical protein F4604DRAFT_1807597 [Suillus subluteus]
MLVIISGLLVSSLIVVSRITGGQGNTGVCGVHHLLCATLLPLSNLGDVYRAIKQSLIDTEKPLHFLNEPTKVVEELDPKDPCYGTSSSFPHHYHAFFNHMRL